MRVAAVQFKSRKGHLAENRARLASLAADAARGADLVVLPELAPSGYLFADRAAAAAVAEAPRGPTYDALAPVARAARCHLVCGFVERAHDRLFNAALVLAPDGGLRGVYRKTLLYEADLPWATPGDTGYTSWDADDGRFAVGICMDLNDDRFLAWVATAGATALAFPTSWVEEGYPVWPYWQERLAAAPGVNLVAANNYGPERGPGGITVFSGRSAVLDHARVRAAAPAQGDAVIRADLRA